MRGRYATDREVFSTDRWLYFRVDRGSVEAVSSRAYSDALVPRVATVDRFGNPIEATPAGWAPPDPDMADAPFTYAIPIDDLDRSGAVSAATNPNEEP